MARAGLRRLIPDAPRELCDLLLMASGRYAALLHSHMHTLDAR